MLLSTLCAIAVASTFGGVSLRNQLCSTARLLVWLVSGEYAINWLDVF